ncbi:carboxypeptidase-like regulatory domain-containing protein [Pedosphaera parvula]|uniref:Uncharacterized protein n=1 Tax=Pedosphaera parvula (strain Ellin514) TaxID=320771 RepID=B9XP38_PEDPL|nr:carboxypeptidase-like regulatory domain-containing protein [Pedosphaera parvula]EEF58394.1 hypothetical protein Cflav_PD6137 [Pedosphaera parvula Ellin514]
MIGGAGTVYTKVNGQHGLLVLNNGGQSGTNTTVSISDSTIDVLVKGHANVAPGGTWSIGNLTVASDGQLLANPNITLAVTSSGAIVVEAGGRVLADGKGAAPGSGAGRSYNDSLYRPCGGGGYGGNGAAGFLTNAFGGTSYGTQWSPTGGGSAGGSLVPYSFGGNGGGAIQFISQNGIVQIDGTISAKGANGSGSGGGGGSGGTISVTGGILLGSGSITAAGGAGVDSIGGGGGGGRIYLTPTSNLFTGSISTAGGGGGNWGGAGTVLIQVSGQNSQLILDNSGHTGTNTLVQSQNGPTDLIIRGGATGCASSPVTFANLNVSSNGWLTPFPGYQGSADSSVNFSFTGNATIQAGGGIIADLAGYPAGQGSGFGHYYTLGSTNFCSGAGHGGGGGSSAGKYALGGNTYDSPTSPTIAGSGGGSSSSYSPYAFGGAGGGVIRLNVTGTLEVDGIISAGGGNGSGLAGGGGSGGSIWLAVGTLSGAGSIAANGGNGAAGLGGGGGGGMIYMPCNNNSFSGTVTAYGGGGANWGGAGTTIIQLPGKNSQLIVDGGGNPGAPTPLPNSTTTDVVLRNGAVGVATSSLTLGNLLISSNAWLIVTNFPSSSATISCLSATIQAGGSIIADSQGYAAGQGSSAGRSSGNSPNYPCGGAGKGGVGGNSISNLALGGNVDPNKVSAGSGGGNFPPYSLGGTGGGSISLTISGLLQVDGIISANGGNGGGFGGGGGAGGSITLTSGSLSGSGVIRANGGGGAGSIGGGGAGGWVTVTVNSTANQFTGAVSAYGGGGANWGGTGVLTIQTNSPIATIVQVILDAGGNPGPATPLTGSSSSTSLTLRNGAVGLINSQLSLGSLLITSNAWLVVSNLPGNATTITLSSATIQAGGGITADSQGYAAGQGSSAGRSSGISPNYPCGGAGKGGFGGNSISNLALGGNVDPNKVSAGSGGGTYSPYSLGGTGGGSISLTISGLLQVDGIISANGGNGSGIGGGGGAGGSITLTSGSLSGSGVIRANGGGGAGSIGGGGAGGWVTVTVNSTANQFTGAVSAYGGGGANWGGTGPVSIQTNPLPGGQNVQLILDAGGNPGPATPLTGSSSSTSLTLRNGAVGLINSQLSLSSLLITSNTWLVVSNFPGNSTTISLSSATIQAGGGITADFQGYAAGLGNGAGHGFGVSPNFPCSGAGHGGNGGNTGSGSKESVVGGTAYDNQTSPSIAGSGGGAYSPYSFGGVGGGQFAITVTGQLQVDGIISANGGNGSGIGGGGGSGGGIKLTAGTLSGSGAIRANGGSGAGVNGGGGAGGCIAIYPTANFFAGTISAGGGGGANWGGAGTIYTQTGGQQSTQLILDNGGQTGASTQIQPLQTTTALILRNGAIGYQQVSSQTFGSLLISSNAWLIANSNSGTLNLTFNGNATIQAGGGIVTDGQGYLAGSGTGAGHYVGTTYYPCSGGSYGGYGGIGNAASVYGGSVYGSITSPTSFGSGGGNIYPYSPGGAGGGAIRLTVNGTLAASGKISANGGDGSGLGGGGGSGGSIFITVGTLAGNGLITANGGDGVEAQGGGGGGGRISIGYNANSFAGLTTAYGGDGYVAGGAGTIYTKANSQSVGPVLVDNGGVAGALTPVSGTLGLPSLPVSLTIQNGAVVSPQASFLQLNNLTVGSGGLFTVSSRPTKLDLLVFNNVDVAPGGAIAVDGAGYGQAAGQGGGQSNGGFGSGAGYGGVGGASSTSPGGASYGSAIQPVDSGSGGGFGSGPQAGGSVGGGAIRLNIGGVLTVDGQLSAGGQMGLQDNSGGGSGGSIWVDAGMLAGNGSIAADGGEGELYGGGGGAGGRIALYSRANHFLGLTSAAGGLGDVSGANGTIFTSNNFPALIVLTNSPSGIVSNAVGLVTLYFNGAPNPSSVTSAAILLMTPNGAVPSSSISISALSSDTYQLSFPLQTTIGNYTLTVGNGVTDLYGQSLAQVYNGGFSISLPVIQGTITDSSGNPVAGVTLQPSSGFSSATTDTNGNYVLGFVPGSSFTVTPSQGTLVFVPGSMSYTNVSTSVSNQNYLAVSTLAPRLAAGVNSTNFVLSWQAIPGVNYQVYSSTNLINWLPYGSALTGSNGPVQFPVPIGDGPQQFFRVQPTD